MRRQILCAALTSLLLTSCSPSGWDGHVENVGTLCDVMRDGQTEARVDLAELAAGDQLVAVGALEGLLGEVTIVDGEVWTSRRADGRLFTQQRVSPSDRAAMLLSTRVREWVEIDVTEDVAPSETADFIRRAASENGLDPLKPFPFRAKGTLHHVRAYVIAGECPVRAQMNGYPMTTPPFAVIEEEVSARLVGFYAEEKEGEMTYHGTRLHAHVVVEGPDAVTGHVDTVGLRSGSKLYLPAR